jgi:hypothetical protein
MVVRALYLKMERGEIIDQMHNCEVTNTGQMERGEISDQNENCEVTYTSQWINQTLKTLKITKNGYYSQTCIQRPPLEPSKSSAIALGHWT